MKTDTLETSVALFPGQGAYRPNCLAALWRAGDPAVRATFEEVDEVAKRQLGRPLTSVVFAAAPPSARDMLANEPELLQLAILATGVAAYRAMHDRGARPSVLVGHSLGELAALTSAGAFSVTDAANALCARMQVLADDPAAAGSMLALDCGRERAQALVNLVSEADLTIAVDNGPAQTVLSGPAEVVRVADAAARAAGISATLLNASHPFHHPLLDGARRELAARLTGIAGAPLAIAVYSPILRRFYRDTDNLGELVSLHLVTPVAFGPTITRLVDAGAGVFVEAGAGRVLTGLVQGMFPACHVAQPLAGRDDEAGLTAAAAALRTPLARTAADRAAAVSAAPAVDRAPAADDVISFDPPVAATGLALPVDAEAPPVTTREAVAGLVRSLYAEALEYPEEVFAEDVLLEADLGVDSVKQTELIGRLGERFSLGPPPQGLRVADYDTFGKVVDFVAAGIDGALISTGAPQ